MPIPILSPNAAAEMLRAGGVVALPTETVYGLAAHALDSKAVQRIFTIKQRPIQDPLIVHLAHAEAMTALAAEIPPAAAQLAQACWPGPLTMILPKRPIVPDLVTAGLPTVALRVPAHPIMQAILAACNLPLAAPSANRFGAVSPTTAEHVQASLKEGPDGIVDGGPCTIGLESTIVAFEKEHILLMRPGAIRAEEITRVTGLPVKPYQPAHPGEIPAPGTMPRHYAPATPARLIEPNQPPDTGKVGYLVFGPGPHPGSTKDLVVNLSPNGNLAEAARYLYAAMREIDQAGCEILRFQPVPETGIGIAINDRLRRAVAR